MEVQEDIAEALDKLLLGSEDNLNGLLNTIISGEPAQSPQLAMLFSFGKFVKNYSLQRRTGELGPNEALQHGINSVLQDPIIQHLISQALGAGLNRKMGV